MHNDSGDEPRIYPVRRDASVYGNERYPDQPGVLVGGAINVDWEDFTALNDGTIIVADSGNNGNDRRDLVLYFIDEPAPTAGRTTFRKKVFFRYPEQTSFPAPAKDFNYDSEATFTLHDQVYIVTKHRSDAKAKVYRLDQSSEAQTQALQLLQTFDVQGQAVAADALPDGSRLVVATYDTLWLFEVTNADRPFDKPIGRLRYEADQVEAVCFDGPSAILLADEATGKLYEVRVSNFESLAPENNRGPAASTEN